MLCAISDQLSSIGSAPTTYLAIFLSTTITALFLFRQHAPRLRPRHLANSPPPGPHLRRTSTSSPLPITTRTPAEIAAFGRFPDYAALSGVPLPFPYHNFNIATACARPYRPFRWPYHQTMSHKKLEPNWWLELESTYLTRLTERMELYLTHGTEVLNKLPGSEPACTELMEMSLQFLAARYPQHFTLNTSTGIFHNKLLGMEFEVFKMCPLMVLLHNIPEDFAVMLRNEESGQYELRAGFVCSSLGWTLQGKIGKALKEIHGPIPDYAEKMATAMDRFFARFPCSAPVQRGSWGLEYQTPLFMPPSDPHMLHRLAQSPDLKLSEIFLRVDWQTLRRLPLSGAIVFNYKALFTPIEQFRDEPGVPGLVLKCLRGGKREIMEYKGTWHVQHVAEPALEEWDREQRDAGVVEREWVVETLEEYPMFRGWREKWEGMQGFEGK